jgi:hypothetical protein
MKIVAQVEDERDQAVHARAIRSGYLAAGAIAIAFSALREFLAGQQNLFWPTAAIVLIPLLLPLGQRLVAGGWAADERIARLETRAFRWASLLGIVSLLVYGIYRDAVYGDVDAMRYFYVSVQTGLMVLIVTRIRHNTLRAPARSWLGSAIVLLFILVLVACPILMLPFSDTTGLRSSAGSIAMSLLMSIILGIHVVVVLSARRQTAEELEERREKQ